MAEQRIQQESSTEAQTGAPSPPYASTRTRTLQRQPTDDPLEWAARASVRVPPRPGSKLPRVPRDLDFSLIIKPKENQGSDEPRTKSGRLVKAPQAFVNEDDPSSRRSQVVSHVGAGVTLGSLPSFQLGDVEDGVLRRLHTALYGTPGKQQSRKKELRDWQGNSADDAESRLQKAVASWTVEELRVVSRLCGLAASKTKSGLEAALAVFLQKPSCVSPGKEPTKPSPKKRSTKRSAEDASSKRAKQKQTTHGSEDSMTSTRDTSHASSDDVDAQYRQYEDLRRPTLVEMYPDLEPSHVRMLVAREWQEILSGANPEDAFRIAWDSLPPRTEELAPGRARADSSATDHS